MLALLDRYPEIARAALKVASGRQRQLAAVAEDLALGDVTGRVARLLLGCVGRHEHIIEGAETACARITQQEIASMVGSVPRPLSAPPRLAIRRGEQDTVCQIKF
jgi:CRP-like cAMP-binding protein